MIWTYRSRTSDCGLSSSNCQKPMKKLKTFQCSPSPCLCPKQSHNIEMTWEGYGDRNMLVLTTKRKRNSKSKSWTTRKTKTNDVQRLGALQKMQENRVPPEPARNAEQVNVTTPQNGQKQMTSLPNHVLYISCLCTFCVHLLCHSWFLWWLLLLFSSFWSLLLTNFFLWLLFKKRGNEDLTRVILFGPGKSKSACVQDDLLFSSHIHDHLLVVLIVDREWPLLAGCHMTCFR